MMDVLNTPNVHGVLLPSPSSYLTLTSYLNGLVMGSSSTFTISYKFDPSVPVRNNTILFACSSRSAAGIQVERIALFTSSKSISGETLTFSVTRGGYTVYSLSANVSSAVAQPPYAHGVFDISVSINIDGSVFMYNHGVLVGSSVNMGLPYVGIRQCSLGRDSVAIAVNQLHLSVR